jgi:hypothetical protein
MSDFPSHSQAEDFECFQIKESLATMRFYIEFEQEKTRARSPVS